MSNILLIDDDEAHLRELAETIALHDATLEVRTWKPAKDENPATRFAEKRDEQTVLVVTDYDLTQQGPPGLLGNSVVAWCQQLNIPVGDFSRGLVQNLPEEPNQYEIRVPANDPEAAAKFIIGVYRGFDSISSALAGLDEELFSKRSPVAVLAEILGRPQEEARFAPYAIRLGSSNPSLKEHIRLHPDPDTGEKRKLLSYVLGHLLLNVVLRYPGPIMNSDSLAAYLGCSMSEVETLMEFFHQSRYRGPFGEVGNFFWLSDADAHLQPLIANLPTETSTETRGELNRLAVEQSLGRELERHDCDICQGVNGGFWCPFTKKPVCQIRDCSVSSNAWIPQGARLCRIKKEFYDEWAPVLGF
jgi:hypothetical protein